MNYLYQSYGTLSVAWTPELNGGGTHFGQQYVPFFEKRIGRTGRVFEFCAGPGFIGFSLLAHGLCDSLCLADVNPAAVEAVRHTIALNALEERVSVYLSDVLSDIPPTEQWDVVVANPPHIMSRQTARGSLRLNDPDWDVHRRFYAGVRSHLKPHGQCILQETYRGSRESTFVPMLEGSGLEYVGSYMLAEGEGTKPLNTYYFFCSRVRHSDVVSTDVPSAREIRLRKTAAGAIVVGDVVPHKPLVLPWGEKYTFSVADDEPGMLVEIRGHDDGVLRQPIPYSSPMAEQPNPRQIMTIPTVPCEIADPGSGRALVTFESSVAPAGAAGAGDVQS